MKIKILSELFSVGVIATLLGCYSTFRMHARWYRLGREALLAHESTYFDNVYSKPPHALGHICTWLLFSILSYALFRGFSFVGSAILTAILKRNEAPETR